MRQEAQAERKHEERLRKPKCYAMQEPVDASPDEITRKVLSVKGYAKVVGRQS